MQQKATFTELSSYQLICMALYKTRVWSLCQAIQGSPLTCYRVFVVNRKGSTVQTKSYKHTFRLHTEYENSRLTEESHELSHGNTGTQSTGRITAAMFVAV